MSENRVPQITEMNIKEFTNFYHFYNNKQKAGNSTYVALPYTNNCLKKIKYWITTTPVQSNSETNDTYKNRTKLNQRQKNTRFFIMCYILNRYEED